MKPPWPKVRLGEVLRRSEETGARLPDATHRKVTVKLWGKGLVRDYLTALPDEQRLATEIAAARQKLEARR